jgi:hypothetical protein
MISALELFGTILDAISPAQIRPTPTPNPAVRISTPTPVPTASHSSNQFPFKAATLLGGIISYLAFKHGGNVHDNGIVTVTSKSVYSGAVRLLTDFSSDSFFSSQNAPGQWICWDFHEMRVCPTHYTIMSKLYSPRSWVVESSLDGVGWFRRGTWIEIDRRKDNSDLKASHSVASFSVSNSAECRFIRLTQTGPNHNQTHELRISAFEIFGTLLEGRQ